jgi:hypothetical protein
MAAACSSSTTTRDGAGGDAAANGGAVGTGGNLATGGMTSLGTRADDGGATGNPGGQGGQTGLGSGGATVSGSGGSGGQEATGSGGVPATGGQSVVGGGGGTTTGGQGTATGGIASGGRGGRATSGVATGGRTGAGSGGLATTGGSTANRTGGATSSTGGAHGSGGATGTPAACCKQFGSASKAGQIAVAGLTQLSGLVASRAHPGVLYAHADTSASAIIYGMTTAGASLGTFTLSGVTVTDWEDIAVGPGPSAGTFVYVGDIGDNAARTGGGKTRTEIQVYRVPEPEVDVGASVGAQTLSNWQRLRFTYPDGAHDAETLMVDPISGDMLIVTKETNGASKVFRAAGSVPADTPTALELVTTLSLGGSGGQGALATAGDISPGGDSIILRTYTAIWLWCRGSTWASTFSASPSELPSASEQQSEGLSFSADGKAWYSAGETSTAIYEGLSGCSP